MSNPPFKHGMQGIMRTTMMLMATNMMHEGLITRVEKGPTQCPWYYGPPMKETWKQRERRLRARADRCR